MIKLDKTNSKVITIKGVYDGPELDKNVIKEQGAITEFLSKNEALIYLGSKEKIQLKNIEQILTKIVKTQKRDYQIDLETFKCKNIDTKQLVTILVEQYHLHNDKLFSRKTKEKDKNKKNQKNLTIINNNEEFKKQFILATKIAKSVSWTRNLQIMPPNFLTSVEFAKRVKEKLSKHENLKVKVLNKKQIQKLKMGLLLAVNKGSAHEPRVVVIEYVGQPKSNEKTVIVGKGITFDSGGYNIKPGVHMSKMKFDMSGAASAAGTMDLIAKIKPKSNFSAILVITDNMISRNAITPDCVCIAMNGKSVEIENTDAEGRLALADGITYAISELNATKVITIATLTGAILVALAHSYAGVWSTNDNQWKAIKEAAAKANEKIWRLPLDETLGNQLKRSPVADLTNISYSSPFGGSTRAAMFLKEFSMGKDFMHIDIAGTANTGSIPKGSMVKTLSFLSLIKN